MDSALNYNTQIFRKLYQIGSQYFSYETRRATPNVLFVLIYLIKMLLLVMRITNICSVIVIIIFSVTECT